MPDTGRAGAAEREPRARFAHAGRARAGTCKAVYVGLCLLEMLAAGVDAREETAQPPSRHHKSPTTRQQPTKPTNQQGQVAQLGSWVLGNLPRDAKPSLRPLSKDPQQRPSAKTLSKDPQQRPSAKTLSKDPQQRPSLRPLRLQDPLQDPPSLALSLGLNKPPPGNRPTLRSNRVARHHP